MLSKAQVKYIRSLTLQKYRKAHNVFIAEGDKTAVEWLLSEANIELIAALPEWIAAHEVFLTRHPEAKLIPVTPALLKQISGLQTPNQVLLVVRFPVHDNPPPTREWTLISDGIRDPGNMGSLIRIADWFGIGHLICSPDTVDVYHPRVVQAAMGSHLRVRFYEMSLNDYCAGLEMPLFAATLEGDNLYDVSPCPAAALIIGNEGSGVSPALVAMATGRITIPRTGGAESLNAAVSAGILCAWLRRPTDTTHQ